MPTTLCINLKPASKLFRAKKCYLLQLVKHSILCYCPVLLDSCSFLTFLTYDCQIPDAWLSPSIQGAQRSDIADPSSQRLLDFINITTCFQFTAAAPTKFPH